MNAKLCKNLRRNAKLWKNTSPITIYEHKVVKRVKILAAIPDHFVFIDKVTTTLGDCWRRGYKRLKKGFKNG